MQRVGLSGYVRKSSEAIPSRRAAKESAKNTPGVPSGGADTVGTSGGIVSLSAGSVTVWLSAGAGGFTEESDTGGFGVSVSEGRNRGVQADIINRDKIPASNRSFFIHFLAHMISVFIIANPGHQINTRCFAKGKFLSEYGFFCSDVIYCTQHKDIHPCTSAGCVPEPAGTAGSGG